MNKLTKVGLSALCGSLAGISAANSGTLDISGSATATWLNNEGTNTGNPIGMNSGITFKGSGELDGGTTFTLTLTQADRSAYSAGSIVMTTPSFGEISIAQANGGNGIDAVDDAMPTAWEETDGAGLTIGQDKISGVGASMNVQYKTPKFWGTTIAVAYSPNNDGTLVNDKASSGATSHKKEGYDVLLRTGGWAGLDLFVGYSETKRDGDNKIGTNVDAESSHEEGVAGVTWVIGPLKVGAQKTGEWLGNEQTGSDVAGYTNTSFGASFNINDNLVVSYGENTSKKGLQSSDNDARMTESKAESLQLSYTMGGASIKIAQTEVENASYVTTTTADREGTTVALSLAF
jgi:hypothetical protein